MDTVANICIVEHLCCQLVESILKDGKPDGALDVILRDLLSYWDDKMLKNAGAWFF